LKKSIIGQDYWDRLATEQLSKRTRCIILAEHKRMVHIDLLTRWVHGDSSSIMLKTDLFEEASGPDQLLFNLPLIIDDVVGIDISHEVVRQARLRAKEHGADATKYISCDVRCLPFKDNVFDIIFSGSTLDHFPTEAEIVTSLTELCRVLRPGGGLILTLDNSSNITYPPYFVMKLWMRLRLAPYIIGRTIPITRLTQILDEIGCDVEEKTAIFHYIHPDVLIRWLEISLRRLSRGKLENMIMKCLCLLDRLEKKRTRFLTGRYIAVKAVKRSGFEQSAL